MALLEATTSLGTVVGTPTGYQASTIFKGIPYAKPPVGPLRWRAPQPAEPWEGTRECYTYSPIPWQKRPDEGTFFRREFYPIPLPMSEDCLYVNVITPAESPDERLPVALWVYGGAFIQGYANKLETDGEAFAKQGIVYVSFNYRVGAFGFLSAPELGEGEGAIQDNCGLLDQIAALDWVRENIAAFGGDPERITVMGQSAGAMSVYNLLCSPLTRGKIAGAVMESGGGLCPDSPCEGNVAARREHNARFIEFLGGIDAARALPGETVRDRWLEFLAANPGLTLPAGPTNDGYALPADMTAALRDGAFSDVPCLIGTTRDEDAVNGSPGTALRDSFLCGTIDLCERQAASGRTPAFMYHITNTPPGDEKWGSFHSGEHMYIFQTFLRSWRPYTGADFDLSNTMCSYWTNFVKTGDPNGESITGAQLPAWPAYTAESKRNMVFDRTIPSGGAQMGELPAYAEHAREMAKEYLGQ